MHRSMYQRNKTRIISANTGCSEQVISLKPIGWTPQYLLCHGRCSDRSDSRKQVRMNVCTYGNDDPDSTGHKNILRIGNTVGADGSKGKRSNISMIIIIIIIIIITTWFWTPFHVWSRSVVGRHHQSIINQSINHQQHPLRHGYVRNWYYTYKIFPVIHIKEVTGQMGHGPKLMEWGAPNSRCRPRWSVIR